MKTYFILKRIQKNDLGSKTRSSTHPLLTGNRDGLPTSWSSTLLHRPSANLKAAPTT